MRRSDRKPIVAIASLAFSLGRWAAFSQHGVQPGTGSLQWWLWGEAGTRGGILSRFSRRISFGRVPALGIARIDWCDAIHAGVLSDTIFLAPSAP